MKFPITVTRAAGVTIATLWLAAGCMPVAIDVRECGDGVTNTPIEQCDDGNTTSGDGCSEFCQREDCSNGRVDPGEVCDDGNTASGDGCSADCRSLEICGNRIVDVGEDCDDGGVSRKCSADCTFSQCGDGFVDSAAGESCDTGGDTAWCDVDCTFALCGDGYHNAAAGEACDDGNASNHDGCTTQCELAACDDWFRNGDETDVDCGGSCPPCLSGLGLACNVDDDCRFGLCVDGTCRKSTPVVAGSSHTCALQDDGSVRCWGYNGFGQLGRGHTTHIGYYQAPSSTELGDPDVPITMDPATEQVVQLAAGTHYTCALLESGNVRCWGLNNDCRLGYGPDCSHRGDDMEDVLTEDIQLVGAATQVVAGGVHTCVLLDNGQVQCWGGNDYGQLGQEDTAFRDHPSDPFHAAGTEMAPVAALQLAAGLDHTCALLETRTVRCWGRNNYGQLGYGHTYNQGDDTNEQPSSLDDIQLPEPVIEIAAGAFHTCALTASGGVHCWGRNVNGQLGYGNTIPIGDDEPPRASPADVGGVVVKLVTGSYHTCAIVDSGAIRCWGSNSNGQLGYSHTRSIGDDEPPSMAGDVAFVSDVNPPPAAIGLTAGGSHTCVALDNEEIRCWGPNSWGLVGQPDITAVGVSEYLWPADSIALPGNVSQIATGAHHTCTLLNDGSVYCWGRNNYGQLGLGNSQTVAILGDDELPSWASPVNVGGPVTDLVAGNLHTCALLTNGDVRCWGYNSNGELGNGNHDHVGQNNSPAEAARVLLPNGSHPLQLAAGNHHTCALFANGTVNCWGYNANGQLGYADTASRNAPGGPVDVGGPVDRIAAGGNHTCALLTNGNVRCWGYNALGQLGYGNTAPVGDDEPPSAAGYVALGADALQLVSGGRHTCALLQGGDLRCWGRNKYGQLGYGHTRTVGDDESPDQEGPVSFGTGTIERIVAGNEHTCVLVNDPDVGRKVARCWGYNAHSQLGYNRFVQLSSVAGNLPLGSDDVSALAANGYHTCAVLTDNLNQSRALCWGDNLYGQLGRGHTRSIGGGPSILEAGDVPYQ